VGDGPAAHLRQALPGEVGGRTSGFELTAIQPPARTDLLREVNLLGDLGRLLFEAPDLARQPKGDGQPVVVLPGFGGSDVSTSLLRAYLRYLDHDARGWGLGRNLGDVAALVPKVVDVVSAISAATGRAIALVGWSLGGVLARETARQRPDAVSRVITLGTPVVGGPKYTATARGYRKRGFDLDEVERIVERHERVPIPVPLTAVYSRSDGIVAWEACLDRWNPEAEHVEVKTTHIGLVASPEVFRLLARKLRLPLALAR
jgi:pimeloyl-ACP methyl ester carboxylesterase